MRRPELRTAALWVGLAALLGLVVYASIRPTNPPVVAPDPDPRPVFLAPDAGPEDIPLTRTERPAMGTIWTISVAGGDPAAARAASNRALDEVERLEALLSEWRPTSQISRVNQAAGGEPVPIGPELEACVKASLDIARWSDGAFDISWAALRGLWDFSADSAHIPPSREAIAARLPLWNWRNIELDEAHHTLRLKVAGMQIGLGGVAKGYALDRAADILRAAGFEDFILFGGGQVYAHGTRGARKWRVGIQHPRLPDYVAYVEVTDASVATSGDYEHAFTHEGRRYHHILDPHTGFPCERSASVTVITPSALWADAIDTAVFILGPEEGLARLARAPGGPYEAVVIDPSMRLTATPGTREKLVMHLRVDDDGTIEDAPATP